MSKVRNMQFDLEEKERERQEGGRRKWEVSRDYAIYVNAAQCSKSASAASSDILLFFLDQSPVYDHMPCIYKI